MRPVLHSDVTAAARVLLAVPAGVQKALCERLLREADWADRFTRRMGKPHPNWGNGTLLAAARAYACAPEPTFDDTAYRAAFELVLAGLTGRKGKGHL